MNFKKFLPNSQRKYTDCGKGFKLKAKEGDNG